MIPESSKSKKIESTHHHVCDWPQKLNLYSFIKTFRQTLVAEQLLFITLLSFKSIKVKGTWPISIASSQFHYITGPNEHFYTHSELWVLNKD